MKIKYLILVLCVLNLVSCRETINTDELFAKEAQAMEVFVNTGKLHNTIDWKSIRVIQPGDTIWQQTRELFHTKQNDWERGLSSYDIPDAMLNGDGFAFVFYDKYVILFYKGKSYSQSSSLKIFNFLWQ